MSELTLEDAVKALTPKDPQVAPAPDAPVDPLDKNGDGVMDVLEDEGEDSGNDDGEASGQDAVGEGDEE